MYTISGERHRLKITFSTYESKIDEVICDTTPPSPPIDVAYKARVAHALNYIPTSKRKATTFNRTRASSYQVTYLLPRREPEGE